jgi:hypothetical protein
VPLSPPSLSQAIVKSNHHLSELSKMSFHKKNPNIINMFLRIGPPPLDPKDTAGQNFKKNVYKIEQKDQFIRDLQIRIRKFK